MTRSVTKYLSEGLFKKVEKEATYGADPPDLDARKENILNKTVQSTSDIKGRLAGGYDMIKKKLASYKS